MKHQMTVVCLFLNISSPIEKFAKCVRQPRSSMQTPTVGEAPKEEKFTSISLQQEAPEARYANACVSNCEIQTKSPALVSDIMV
jgi:hypothetical protein